MEHNEWESCPYLCGSKPNSYDPGSLATSSKAGDDHSDLLAFLAVAQTHLIDFLPITWQPSLGSVGSGASGDVLQSFVVKQLGLAFKQFSALPTSSETTIKGMIREILILQHPPIQACMNIINLEGICWKHDDIHDDMSPVLVYRLGRSLVDHLADTEPSFKSRLQYVKDIGYGLMVLHASGAVHGDLKPENIIMSTNHRVTPPTAFPQTADFNSSQFSLGKQERFYLPKSKPWFAPEWHVRSHTCEQAQCMDVYSYGLLSYWILFGKNIFNAAPFVDDVLHVKKLVASGTLLETLCKQIRDTEQAKDSVDDLEDFFLGCLSIDPKKRFPHISRRIPLLRDVNPGTELTIAEEHPKHLSFSLVANLDQIMQLDHKIRRKIFQVLEKSLNSQCLDCVKNGALQTALCHYLALGTIKDVQMTNEILARYDLGQLDLQQQIKAIRDCQFLSRPGMAKWYVEPDLVSLYQERGELDEAIKWHKEEILALKGCLGTSHQLVAMSTTTLAHLLDGASQTLQALDLCMKLWEDVKSRVNEDHHDALAAQSQVALYQWKAGRENEAIITGERLLELIRSSKTIKEADRLAMSSYSNIAGAYADAMQHEKAVPILERLVEVHDTVLGPDHPESLTCRQTLAACYVESIPPRFREALGLQAVVLKGWRKNYCPEHRHTISAAVIYASMLRREGSDDQLALDLHKWTMEASIERFSEKNPDRWIATSNYAYALLRSRRFEEATTLLHRSLQNLEQILPTNHRSTIDVMLKLSSAYIECDRIDEAETLLLRVLHSEACRTQLKPTIYLWVWQGLGNVYHKRKEIQKAKEAWETALAFAEKRWGLHHPAVRLVMKELGLLHIQAGDHDKGIHMLEEVAVWCEEYLGKSAWYTIIYKSELGANYIVVGNYTKAHEILSDVYLYATDSLGATEIETMDVQGNLAYALHRVHKSELAKELTEDLLSKRQSVLGQLHEDTILTIRNLFRIYIDLELWPHAELLVPQAVAILDHLGDDFEDHTSTLLYLLAEFYAKSEKLRQGEKFFRDRLSSLNGLSGCERTLSTVNYCLAYILSATDQIMEAAALMRLVVEQRLLLYGEFSSPTCQAQGLLGVILRDIGDLAGAEEMFQQEIRTATSLQDGLNSSDIEDAFEHLITVYNKQGLTAKVFEIKKEMESLGPR